MKLSGESSSFRSSSGCSPASLVVEEKETGEDKSTEESSGISSSRWSLPCKDKQLQDELSCPICLEILFEPSTTSCGHSFCRKCLISAADKWAERCPICRWPTSIGRFCIVNTVLWNIIQFLFPQEVEARKAAEALNSQDAERQSLVMEFRNFCNLDYLSNQRAQASAPSSRDIGVRRRRATSRQGKDAELHNNVRVMSSQGGEEVEARKAPRALNSREAECDNLSKEIDYLSNQSYLSNQRAQASAPSSRDIGVRRRRAISRQGEDAELHNNVRRAGRDVGASSRGIPNQDEAAALAQRLQGEEFMMEAFGGTDEQSSRSLSSARANFKGHGI